GRSRPVTTFTADAQLWKRRGFERVNPLRFQRRTTDVTEDATIHDPTFEMLVNFLVAGRQAPVLRPRVPGNGRHEKFTARVSEIGVCSFTRTDSIVDFNGPAAQDIPCGIEGLLVMRHAAVAAGDVVFKSHTGIRRLRPGKP